MRRIMVASTRVSLVAVAFVVPGEAAVLAEPAKRALDDRGAREQGLGAPLDGRARWHPHPHPLPAPLGERAIRGLRGLRGPRRHPAAGRAPATPTGDGDGPAQRALDPGLAPARIAARVALVGPQVAQARELAVGARQEQ